jgi:CRISPR-associated protein Csh1
MFSKINHQKNFGICRECYEKLMFGEKRIMSDYKIKIAREDCVILFNSLDKDIELENFYKIKDDIDIAFNTKETQEWTEMFKNEITDWQQSELYEFSIIFYKTDGKSCNIRKTIESISSIRFGYVINTFESIRRTFGERLKYFNLGNLYGIVPVSSSKDGEQLNILRLLNLYGAILKSESVSKNYIFDLACEALEKGLNELNSSKVHNYKNLYKIMYLKDKESGKDIYINKIMMSYIAFFHVLQKLKILDKEVFMDENKKKTEEVLPDKIIASEKFLDEQGFSTEARGLFYIGMLTHIIGVAQYKQGHKYKPILDKMTYSGMSNYDVMEFYLELVEKTRQYKKYVNIWLCERLEKKIHENLSDLEKAKLFNEKENVFFIMSGYAYCVEYSKKDNMGKDNNEEEKNND